MDTNHENLPATQKDTEGTSIFYLGAKQRHSLILLLEIISSLRNIDPDAQELIGELKHKNISFVVDEFTEVVLQIARSIKTLVQGHKDLDWQLHTLRYLIRRSEGVPQPEPKTAGSKIAAIEAEENEIPLC